MAAYHVRRLPFVNCSLDFVATVVEIRVIVHQIMRVKGAINLRGRRDFVRLPFRVHDLGRFRKCHTDQVKLIADKSNLPSFDITATD